MQCCNYPKTGKKVVKISDMYASYIYALKICNVLNVDHKSSIHSRHLPLLPCAIVIMHGSRSLRDGRSSLSVLGNDAERD